MTKNFYILKDKKLVKVGLLEWGKWLEDKNNKRIIKQEILPDGKWISTVFIGIDHNFAPEGKELLFETMVFPNKHNSNELDVVRYSTWDEAEIGHKQMVKKWSNGIILSKE